MAQAFDMHSFTVSSLHHKDEDHIESADDVIKQIENMMKDTSAKEADNPIITEDEQYPEVRAILVKLLSYKEPELKEMTCAELHELLAEYERSINELSKLLVTVLALRDELEYCKQQKKSIYLLLSMLEEGRDTNADRKKKKTRNSQDQGCRCC